MSSTSRGAVAGLRTAYSSGSVAGLTDSQLLERFVSSRDDNASFEALLTRHGPMVLGVCRALLRDEHAADDAFQATFLVLVKKAKSVRAGDSLGRWLYGVARKVAVRSRSDSAKRQAREQTGAEAPEPEANNPDAFERADLREAVHEELSRLSETARAAIVLCHLEGLSHEEAATRLGWPVGTVRSRLARGRDRLRVGLSRRGFADAVPLASISPTMVPERLLVTTKLAASKFLTGEAIAAGVVPASVLALTTGVLHAMTFTKILTATGLIAAASLVGLGGAGIYASQDAGKPAAKTDSVSAESKTSSFAQGTTSKPVNTPELEADWARLSARRIARYAGSVVQRGPIAEGPNLTPSQVLAAQLEQARSDFVRTEKLYAKKITSASDYDKAKSDLQIIQGRIAGRIDDLEDELEFLEARLLSKKAEVDVANARVDVSKVTVSRNERISARLKGAVSDDDIMKDQAENRRAEAERDVKVYEIQECKVLIKQTKRQLDRFKALLKPAK